jgi:hypothetical protein
MIATKNPNRTKTVPIRVTDDFYADLKSVSASLELPVSTVCFLAVKKYMAERADAKYETSDLDLI